MAFSFGHALGGALTGFVATGGNPLGLLMGIPAGMSGGQKPPSVDSVLPRIDADKMATDTIKDSNLGADYGRMVGAASSNANQYYGNLVAAGVDSASAARMAEAQKTNNMAKADDALLDTEAKMMTSLTTQYKPYEMQREEDRQSYQNEVNNQPNALETYGPAVLQAALGNIAAGGGILGTGANMPSWLGGSGIAKNVTDQATKVTSQYDAAGNLVNTGDNTDALNPLDKSRGWFQSALFGATKNETVAAPAEKPFSFADLVKKDANGKWDFTGVKDFAAALNSSIPTATTTADPNAPGVTNPIPSVKDLTAPVPVDVSGGDVQPATNAVPWRDRSDTSGFIQVQRRDGGTVTYNPEIKGWDENSQTLYDLNGATAENTVATTKPAPTANEVTTSGVNNGSAPEEFVTLRDLIDHTPNSPYSDYQSASDWGTLLDLGSRKGATYDTSPATPPKVRKPAINLDKSYPNLRLAPDESATPWRSREDANGLIQVRGKDGRIVTYNPKLKGWDEASQSLYDINSAPRVETPKVETFAKPEAPTVTSKAPPLAPRTKTPEEIELPRSKESKSQLKADNGSSLPTYAATVAKEEGIDEKLLLKLIETESGWNHSARNAESGAYGLTQLMPSTLADPGYGIPKTSVAELKNNPKLQIKRGAQYLKAMMTKYKNVASSDRDSTVYAIAAYNWGPGRVDAAIRLADGDMHKFLRIVERRSPETYRYINSLLNG